ncbi:GDSL esterase/lipase CPRD49 [Glycine max]|nr:GDSL esterase/lipase CPRD49 [Glycine max]
MKETYKASQFTFVYVFCESSRYIVWNSWRALQNLDKIFPKDATNQQSLVIVYFGGNDSMHRHLSGLSPHVPLQEYIENMKKIVIHLKYSLHPYIISMKFDPKSLWLPKPFKEDSSPPINEVQMHETLRRTNEACQTYSEACLELCYEMKPLISSLHSGKGMIG